MVTTAMTWLYALTFAVLLTCASVVAEPIRYEEIHIADGDTISTKGKTYRLVGFDTPETFKAKCEEERALGVRAYKRLRELLLSGGIDLTPVRCSCYPGTEGTRYCNWGRACAKLTVKGIDVGTTLISEGLARKYECGVYRCPKRKGWCER
jgi:endonuclease YncB( thermonuclease family)